MHKHMQCLVPGLVVHRYGFGDFTFGDQTLTPVRYDGFMFSVDTTTGALGWIDTYPSHYSDIFGLTVAADGFPVVFGIFYQYVYVCFSVFIPFSRFYTHMSSLIWPLCSSIQDCRPQRVNDHFRV